MKFTYFLLTFLPYTIGQQETPVVYLSDNSPVKGIVTKGGNGKTVSKFLGIPYAEPPVGNSRFKPPVTKRPWENVALNASSFSKACVQKGVMWAKMSRDMMSEDCLYLNIWVPGHVNQKSNLAVMVWIYGGGYYAGAASEEQYEASVFSTEEQVIIVSMNYRLSIFGFLYADNSEAPGNVGLLDQLEALKWTHRNIEKFGGNPKSVTIFGESCGAASVGFHALSPLSAEYFNRIILQSGTPLSPWALNTQDQLRSYMKDVAAKMGCGSDVSMSKINPDIIQCLRSIDPYILESSIDNVGPEFLTIIWTPVIDNHFIPKNPLDLLRNGDFINKDLLIG